MSSSIYKYYLNCSLKAKGDGSFESPFNGIPDLDLYWDEDRDPDRDWGNPGDVIFEILDGPEACSFNQVYVIERNVTFIGSNSTARS